MNVYFDNIINNIPVPNGVSSKSSIDAFINDKRYFSKETILVIPEFIRILKDYINLKKTNDAGKGVYPISIYQPSALTKQYCKDMWVALWSKTTIDEKAINTVKEIKKRYKLTADELADVAKAIKEVGNQIDDIDNALKGEARKGRKNGK